METTDRDTLDCVIRETWEEVRIALDRNKIEKVAIITFYFGGEPSFEVHVYRTSDFTGTPFKTKSMIPKWYEMKELPVLVKERMLESDRTWFPRAVSGEKFCANVYYKEKAKGFLKIDFLPFIDHE
jgi:8-oxo-dGTP pyrophosphatase MutT (NUDIX family)